MQKYSNGIFWCVFSTLSAVVDGEEAEAVGIHRKANEKSREKKRQKSET